MPVAYWAHGPFVDLLDPRSRAECASNLGDSMTTFDQMQQCSPVSLREFRAKILGLRYAHVQEAPTDGGRVLFVHAGDKHGPIVGFRDDYLGHSTFYLRR